MLPDELTSLDFPENYCEVRDSHVLYAVKLLLFAAILPVLISLVTELAQLLPIALMRQPYIDSRLTPIATYIGIGTIVAVVVVTIMFFAAISFLPLACFFIPVWKICCFLVGMICEIVFIVPRIFVGSLLDPLWPLSAKPLPRGEHIELFSLKMSLVLLIIASLIASASAYLWFPRYQNAIDRARQQSKGEANEVVLHWQAVLIKAELDRACAATTIDDADRYLSDAIALINLASKYTEKERRDAVSTVNQAQLELSMLRAKGEPPRELWQRGLIDMKRRIILPH